MSVRNVALICVLTIFALSIAACGGAAAVAPRTITVAQSGQADIVGADSAALQKAAALLRPGDTLSIGPGTYRMDNSLFVPSGVTVRGVGRQTILLKNKGAQSPLLEDGDYGEWQLRVADPSGFRAGMGLTILDDASSSGWDVSVTTIQAVQGNLLRIKPMTLRDYNVQEKRARAQNTFPVLAVMEAEDVLLEDLIVDGNKAENQLLDGCRGGAIYMYLARNVTVRNCVARNYYGDGISFQITERIRVENCESYGHAGFGVHPGTGSDKPLVTGSKLHHNGEVGLFLCWRVRHGEFTGNVIEDNGRYGISIGHKDTDNLFTGNTIARNGFSGVYFRPETFANSGHRNTFRGNTLTDNGDPSRAYGFYVEPHAGHIVVEDNRFVDQRASAGGERFAVYKVAGAGPVNVASNKCEGRVAEFKEGARRAD
ncbi:MAG: right-handed parallel beta-helix repeat-containing protein [Bryobacteraceae bacterium]|nr:right-handed parallel beta-helix repeat-containing protein [Bryobacteraceae bacterium]